MQRKIYEIKIKMIKEITLNHEQDSMEKALYDIRTLIKHSSTNDLNKIFNSKPTFVYNIKII